MKRLIWLLATAATAAPLFVFENGVGEGKVPPAEQAELARRTGYSGVFYSGTKNIPELVKAHRERGLRIPGIYTGMNLSDAKPGYDPGLPAAIRELKGTGALIAFTVMGKPTDGDRTAVDVIRQVADMAAASGLRVVLYPHYGFHVARIEDALRVRDAVARPNVGIVFNLCHWLRSGDEANLDARLAAALPWLWMVSINGADHTGDWDRLIQPLDRGNYDVRAFVAKLRRLGYTGPIGLQCYNIPGDREENLRRSMRAWQSFATDLTSITRQRPLHDPAVKVRPTYIPLPPGAVRPEGWLKEWAVTASHGITGHLDEYSATYGNGWKGFGFTARGANPDGTGWPLEQSSYWLDGAVRLAWILNDEALQRKVRDRLDRVVDGVLNGGETFIYWRPAGVAQSAFNSWAHSHMGRALVAYYQATGDERILRALAKVYHSFTPPDTKYEDVIGAVNADPMSDTFLYTGDTAILRNALTHTATARYQAIRSQWRGRDVTPGHGVIFYEDLRLPATFYPWTGNTADLEATRGALDWHDRTQLLPIGISSSEEYHAGIGATRNVETCNVAASIWTWLSLLRLTGEGNFSDRIERVFFNAAPAIVDRQFETMSYYQCPNRYSETNPAEAPGAPGGGGSYRFSNIGHEVLCCVGNLNRVIPFYTQHLWMATLDDGLAATLYGPSTVTAPVAGGVAATITTTTTYPFEETIRLGIQMEKPARFPLSLHLPAWSAAPVVRLNGSAVDLSSARNGFLRIDREWQTGDRIELHFPMRVHVREGRETPYPAITYFKKSRRISQRTDIHSPWRTVDYGPLLFALPLKDITPNQVAPGQPFQYAMPANPGIRVTRRPLQPNWNWSLDAPIQLTATLREFAWQPTELEPLPPEPVRAGAKRTVTLVPYGSTKFRVTMFPVTR